MARESKYGQHDSPHDIDTCPRCIERRELGELLAPMGTWA